MDAREKRDAAEARFAEEPVVTNRKILSLLQMYQTIKVGRQEISEDYDIDFDVMRYLVSEQVAVEHLAEDEEKMVVEHKVPASTWQMFKQTHQNSWWMGWLVTRHPVVEATSYEWIKVRVSRYLKYPDVTVSVSGQGKPVIHEFVTRLS